MHVLCKRGTRVCRHSLVSFFGKESEVLVRLEIPRGSRNSKLLLVALGIFEINLKNPSGRFKSAG